MRNWRLFGLAGGLFAAAAWASGLWGGPLPAQPTAAAAGGQPPAAADAAGKGKRAQAFIDAFNAGDAKAVAGFWTPTGEYTDQDGRKYRGREELEKLYAGVFAANKGAKLTITATAARMVGADVAIEEGLTEVTPAAGGPPTVAAFAAVLVKKDGEWYFESVRDSLAHPPTNAAHLDGLAWLLGEWASEAAKGESSRASYAWAENRNFIVSSFDTLLGGVPVVGGTQWIGWDAADKRVRSWSFYSGGGFGEAAWTRAGDAWSLATTARTADGKKISVTNVITPADNDHFTLQMTKLVVDGKPMPDPAPVKMARVKGEK